MTNTPLSQSRTWFITFVILLALGGFLRLLDITDPPLDFHPSRQLRNSLVARDIYYSILPSATTEQRDLAASFARSVGKYEPPVIESIVAYRSRRLMLLHHFDEYYTRACSMNSRDLG